jgi:hypothetical protein
MVPPGGSDRYFYLVQEVINMTDQSAEQATPARHRAALAIAKATPTRHVPRHVTREEVRQRLHGESAVGRFNNMVAVAVTRGVGSMWAAYLFVLIALVSFPAALTAFLAGDTVTGVAWLSQSFLQLVLLPILLVGQQVIAAAQDARAETDHETLTALHTINVQQLEILETLAAMRKRSSDR